MLFLANPLGCSVHPEHREKMLNKHGCKPLRSMLPPDFFFFTLTVCLFACVFFLGFFSVVWVFFPVCTLRLLFNSLKEQTKELNKLADVPHFMAC